jgi:hypothetical protein
MLHQLLDGNPSVARVGAKVCATTVAVTDSEIRYIGSVPNNW